MYIYNIDDFRRVHESYDFVWLSCLRNVLIVVAVVVVHLGGRCQSPTNTTTYTSRYTDIYI